VPDHGGEGFLELPGGGGVHPQAALLQHHVALAVEFPEHGVLEPVRLQPGPELQLVGGHVDVVEGPVLGGIGVHAGGAEPLVDLVQLVLDDQGALLLHLAVQGVQQLLVSRRAGLGIVQVADLAAAQSFAKQVQFGAEARDGLVLEGVELGIALGVARADDLGALEHHVLEEVGDPRDAGALVGRTDPGHPAAGDAGLVVALHHEDAQAVGEGVGGDGQVLGRERREGQQGGCNRPAVEMAHEIS